MENIVLRLTPEQMQSNANDILSKYYEDIKIGFFTNKFCHMSNYCSLLKLHWLFPRTKAFSEHTLEFRKMITPNER